MTRQTPNILLVVSDDHGYADRSAVGLIDGSTPALDRLAAEGTSFTNAYVTAPICSPSRAAMITGQYQQRWGATWFDSSDIGEAPTIAERLRERGYTTGYFGKVHYGPEGPGDRGTPPQHGFDESFYGLAGQSMGRLHYLTHSGEAMETYGEAAEAMAVQPLWSGEAPVEDTGFLTDEFADRAGDFIERHRDEPFFAMVAFNAVHNFCWQLPEAEREKRGLPAFEDWHPGASEYLDWYDGAISPNLPHGREYYAAQLELMDRQIGALLDRLDTLGIADDTIVVYLTDNGGSTCNYGDNSPLRGTKYTLWEGGIRVPFLVRWPGVAPEGADNDSLVSSLDLAATFLTAAGADAGADTEARVSADEGDSTDAASGAVPPDGNAQHDAGRGMLRGDAGRAAMLLDGQNLAEVLAKGSGHDQLHWDCDWQWAVREGDWKLSWCDGSSEFARYVREVEHTTPGDGFFLCDLAADPSETENLADSYPEIVERLTQRHRKWREEVGLSAAR